MLSQGPAGYAFNRTRHAYLATRLTLADTHWSRFIGLMGTSPSAFRSGEGLWIVPSHGVHTFAMRFPIDVVYLDRSGLVIYLEKQLKPWRLAPVRRKAVSVLELPGKTLDATGTSLGDELEVAMGPHREAIAQ
jgi:uncharacterized protein